MLKSTEGGRKFELFLSSLLGCWRVQKECPSSTFPVLVCWDAQVLLVPVLVCWDAGEYRGSAQVLPVPVLVYRDAGEHRGSS